MPVSLQDAALYLAYALKQKRPGADCGVAVHEGKVVGVGVQATPTDTSRSPAVNMIQDDLGPCDFIALTAPPGRRCRGMATMMRSCDFVYVDGGRVVRSLRTSADNWTESTASTSRVLETATPVEGFASKNIQQKCTDAKAWVFLNKFLQPHVSSKDFFLTFTVQAARPSIPKGYDLKYASARPAARDLDRLDTPNRHQIFMLLAWALVTTRILNGDVSGHHIGSVVRGPDDQILAWGLNHSNVHKTLHGETLVCQKYFSDHHSGFPRGSILYTTLEPCHMCAGMIVDSAPGIDVVYSQKDANIHDSVLNRRQNGCQQKHFSEVDARILSPVGKLNARLAAGLGSGRSSQVRSLYIEGFCRRYPLATEPIYELVTKTAHKGIDLEFTKKELRTESDLSQIDSSVTKTEEQISKMEEIIKGNPQAATKLKEAITKRRADIAPEVLAEKRRQLREKLAKLPSQRIEALERLVRQALEESSPSVVIGRTEEDRETIHGRGVLTTDDPILRPQESFDVSMTGFLRGAVGTSRELYGQYDARVIADLYWTYPVMHDLTEPEEAIWRAGAKILRSVSPTPSYII